MPRPFPDILSGKGREVFLGTFLYYRIECILELLGKPFHMFLGAKYNFSVLNVRRMIQYMHYQNKQQEANSHPKQIKHQSKIVLVILKVIKIVKAKKFIICLVNSSMIKRMLKKRFVQQLKQKLLDIEHQKIKLKTGSL